MSVEGIQKCAGDELARIEIAKSRMDDELALYIHTAQNARKIQCWKDVVDYLQTEFKCKC